MPGSRRFRRALMLLTVVVCTQVAGCGAVSSVAGAAAAMVGIVQANELLAPYFEWLGF